MRLITRTVAPIALLMAFLAPAATASAAPADSTRMQEIRGGANSCNGEAIRVTGTLHTVIKVQQDGSYVFHQTLHATGVGDQGNRYVMYSIWKETGLDISYSVSQRVLMVSKGSAPNRMAIFHADSDGNSDFDVDCRG